MLSQLSKEILSTIVYYDVLDYPLTAFEIWKYLAQNTQGETPGGEKVLLVDVFSELNGERLEKHIEEYRGFYFLAGRVCLVDQRIRRNKLSTRKLKIIRRLVFWLRAVPYVRMIAVTGRVAMKNAEKKSDLDLLIVLKEGRIFTGRLLMTMATHFLGKRRYAEKITDRLCLNFFLADNSLEINLKDIYSSSEYSFIYPIFGWETFQKFQKTNLWISNFKPNFSSDGTANAKMLGDSGVLRALRVIGEKLLNLNFLENALKNWQMRRIMSDPRTYQKGSAVMAGEKALIFLPEPQGPKVYEKFREKLDVFS